MDMNKDEVTQMSGNVDTVHCSFYCKFTPTFLDNLDIIRSCKRIAENPSDADDAPLPEFVIGDNIYVVMPYGFSPDKGMSRYCYYKYVLKCGGITIGIQPRECRAEHGFGEESTDSKKSKSNPNVRVEVGRCR